MTDSRTRLVVGCMTGTSLDGLDVALVKITGTGLDMRAELLGHHALTMPDELRATLMSLASGESSEPIVYMRAARALGELHADGVEQLLQLCSLSLEKEGRGEGGALSRQAVGDKNIASKIDFITAHGQTIWHAPRPRNEDAEAPHALGPMSWQLFDPWPVVRRLKLPVCYDLRQADLIAGGEGAPLTPIADWVMYRGRASFVFNLGGIANYTSLVGEFEDIHAGDLYPCNILLDGLSQRLLGQAYDHNGQNAMRGVLNRELMHAIDRAVRKQSGYSESLGREMFSSHWLDIVSETMRPMAPGQDILRSAVWAMVNDLCSPIYEFDGGGEWDEGHVHTLVVAGGGSRNQAIVKELQQQMNEYDEDETSYYQYEIALSDDLGIPCEARESMGFAVLGALSQDGVPISLPQVTGATDPGVAGVWAYP